MDGSVGSFYGSQSGFVAYDLHDGDSEEQLSEGSERECEDSSEEQLSDDSEGDLGAYDDDLRYAGAMDDFMSTHDLSPVRGVSGTVPEDESGSGEGYESDGSQHSFDDRHAEEIYKPMHQGGYRTGTTLASTRASSGKGSRQVSQSTMDSRQQESQRSGDVLQQAFRNSIVWRKGSQSTGVSSHGPARSGSRQTSQSTGISPHRPARSDRRQASQSTGGSLHAPTHGDSRHASESTGDSVHRPARSNCRQASQSTGMSLHGPVHSRRDSESMGDSLRVGSHRTGASRQQASQALDEASTASTSSSHRRGQISGEYVFPDLDFVFSDESENDSVDSADHNLWPNSPRKEFDMKHHFLELKGVYVTGLEGVNGRYERTPRVSSGRSVWEKFHTGKRNVLTFLGCSWVLLSCDGVVLLQNNVCSRVPPKAGWVVDSGNGIWQEHPGITLTPIHVPDRAADLRTTRGHRKLYEDAEDLAIVARQKRIAAACNVQDQLDALSVHKYAEGPFPLYLASRKTGGVHALCKEADGFYVSADASVEGKRVKVTELKNLRLVKLSEKKAVQIMELARGVRRQKVDPVRRGIRDTDPVGTTRKMAKLGVVRHSNAWVQRQRKVLHVAPVAKSKKVHRMSGRLRVLAKQRTLTKGAVEYLADKERREKEFDKDAVMWSTVSAEQKSVERLHKRKPLERIHPKAHLVHRWPHQPFERKRPCDTINALMRAQAQARREATVTMGDQLHDPESAVAKTSAEQEAMCEKQADRATPSRPSQPVSAKLSSVATQRVSSTEQGPRSISKRSSNEPMASSKPPYMQRASFTPAPRVSGKSSRVDQGSRPATTRASLTPAPRKTGTSATSENASHLAPRSKQAYAEHRSPWSVEGAIPNQSACSKAMSGKQRVYRQEMMRLGMSFGPNGEINPSGYSTLQLRKKRKERPPLKEEVSSRLDLLYSDAEHRRQRLNFIRRERQQVARKERKAHSLHKKEASACDPILFDRLAVPRGHPALAPVFDQPCGPPRHQPPNIDAFKLDMYKRSLSKAEAQRVGFVIWDGHTESNSAEAARVMQKVSLRLLV